jgi:hypothetical protein
MKEAFKRYQIDGLTVDVYPPGVIWKPALREAICADLFDQFCENLDHWKKQGTHFAFDIDTPLSGVQLIRTIKSLAETRNEVKTTLAYGELMTRSPMKFCTAPACECKSVCERKDIFDTHKKIERKQKKWANRDYLRRLLRPRWMRWLRDA